MKNVILILFLHTITVGCSVNNKYNSNSHIIRKWNQSTLLSVKRQPASSDDRLFKQKVRNDLKTMELYLEKNSLRSDFFKSVVSADKSLNNFFIVEFVVKEERFRIKNALVVNDHNVCKVTFFEFFDQKWKNIGSATFDNMKLSDEDFDVNTIKIGKNLGLKNVVISKFNSGNVISYYYGDSMPDKNSFFYEILVQGTDLN